MKNRVIALMGFVALIGFKPPAFAAPDVDATLSVRPFSGVPPASIAGLTVAPTTTEGQIRLNWTAPSVFPGTTLDSYEVRIQTFSLASVGGSTTTWWNNSTGFTTQGFYSEVPGAAVTRTLGPPGSTHTAPLYPGATYYVAVRSADDMGTERAFYSSFVATPSGSPLDVVPGTPTGLLANVTSSDVTLSWTDLTSTEKGMDFDGYRVYRSLQSNTGFVLLATVTGTSLTDNAVVPGGHYYYRVTAIDRGVPTYPGTALESAPSTEANVTIPGSSSGTTPRKPNALSATLALGTNYTLTWRPVTTDMSGNAVTIDHYEIERYNSLGGTATFTTAVVGAATYSENTTGLTYFYRIRAISTQGLISDWSDYMDSSNNTNRYALASDDLATKVVMPYAAARELIAENNPYNEDIEIQVLRRSQDEVDVTLRSYRIVAVRVNSGNAIPGFTFAQNTISVQLGYGAVIGNTLTPNQVLQLTGSNNALAQSVLQVVSVYWFNGSSFLRISDPLLTQDQAFSVVVRNLGIYQLRAVRIGERFQLTQGSPYPRVITPKDPSQNNRVFFFFDNPSGETVTGTIYDIRGAKVRDLQVDSMSPTSNSIVWDGRDSRGAVVPSGVYLYKITTGKEKATGTIVVAR